MKHFVFGEEVVVHKRRPKLEGGVVCPVRLGDFFRCERLPFLKQKSSDFLKFIMVERREGWPGKGERYQFFVILCGRLLWMATNNFKLFALIILLSELAVFFYQDRSYL